MLRTYLGDIIQIVSEMKYPDSTTKYQRINDYRRKSDSDIEITSCCR
jgi:hypothetical protein